MRMLNANAKLSNLAISLKYVLFEFQSARAATKETIKPIKIIGNRAFLKLKISEKSPSKPRQLNMISVFNYFYLFNVKSVV